MSSKTPIMILQERCVKQNSMMPIYDLIDGGNKTHINAFKYRVRCDGLVAEGSGPNKKEAKQNAANEMLILLNENIEQISTNKSIRTELQNNIMPGGSNNSTGDEQSTDFYNAIGILQEHCMQNRLQCPVYKIVKVSGPTHLPSFTFDCTISVHRVEASASTKKQAKNNAAKKMLQHLGIVIEPSIPINGNIIESQNAVEIARKGIETLNLKIEGSNCSDSVIENRKQISTSKSMRTELQDNIMPGGSNKSTGDEQSTGLWNAVGILQEHCVRNKLHSPVYNTVNVSGPPHLRTFTLACNISMLRVETSASTKKQAKHDAAKKMLQHLGIAIESSNIIESQNAVEIARKDIETLNLEILEPNYSDNVIEKYKRATNLPILEKPSTSVANCHLYFKTLYAAEQQKLLHDKVENVYTNVRSTGGLTQWKAALKVISLAFDFKFECFILYTKEQSAKKMIGYTLHTTPLIIEIGYGNNLVDAETEAIRKILTTLQILLM